MPPTAPSPKTRSKPRSFAVYEALRNAYVNGTFKTLEEVALASGIPFSTITKKSAADGWEQQRKVMEEKVREERDKATLKTKATMLKELDEQALKVANFLIGKAIVTLDKKALNAEGQMVQVPFNTESAAIQALAQGFRMQRMVAGAPTGEGPDEKTEIPDDERALRQMSAEQLEKLYRQHEARIVEPASQHPKGISGTQEGSK